MSVRLNDLKRREEGKELWCTIEVFLSDEEKDIIESIPKGDPDNIVGRIITAGISAIKGESGC